MKRFVSGRPYWWQWFTILSLDATAVSLAWQAIFARAGGIRLGRAEEFVLGASVWLAYTADRWIEGWRLKPSEPMTQRHHFAARWRWPLFVVWCLILTMDVATAFIGLTLREFLAGACLLGPVLIYLLSHQLWHRKNPWRLPKELCVAALITGGALVFVVAAPKIEPKVLIFPALHFAALCFVNCFLISLWEQEVDRGQGQDSLALELRSGIASRLGHLLPWALGVEAGLSVWWFSNPSLWARKILLCVAASAVLLGLADRMETRIGRQLARVLSDLVLLTPIFVMITLP